MINLTGKRFGMLSVVRFLEIKDGQRFWLCKCECGGIKTLSTKQINSKRVVSCGCIVKGEAHGLSSKRLYNIWKGMKSRCYNSSVPSYTDYGGRGVTICNQWLNSFKNFYEWAINNGYEPHLSIDRIDANGNYAPNNCRWATSKTQAVNKRSKGQGIRKIKDKDIYEAYIYLQGKKIILGQFKTESEAKAHREQAEKMYYLIES